MSTDHKNIRTAILDAALDLFAEHGFHASPMSRLATIAGVGVGSIYRYFSDKDALIHAVYETVDGSLQRTMEENTPSTVSSCEQFTHFVRELIAYLFAHPKEFRFLEQYYNSPYGNNKVHAKILREDAQPTDLFMGLFVNGRQAGTIRDLPLPVYMVMTFGPVSHLVRYSLAGHIVVTDEIIQATAEACWNAIKA